MGTSDFPTFSLYVLTVGYLYWVAEARYMALAEGVVCYQHVDLTETLARPLCPHNALGARREAFFLPPVTWQMQISVNTPIIHACKKNTCNFCFLPMPLVIASYV